MEMDRLVRIDKKITRLSKELDIALTMACGPSVLFNLKAQLEYYREQQKLLKFDTASAF